MESRPKNSVLYLKTPSRAKKVIHCLDKTIQSTPLLNISIPNFINRIAPIAQKIHGNSNHWIDKSNI
ncbi:TPA: hypothetical protein DIC40_05680 [Patescibacteria group bacterium]|nr:hypothetical protein [Candidatus Gracilibacteria bacterium]